MTTSANHVNARKTHCKNGHEFTPENTYVSHTRGPPMRQCRQCRKDRWAANYKRVVRLAPLDAGALRRLRRAAADGVSHDDLSERFGVTTKTIRDAIRASGP